jgi:transcriptional regulator with XRE-family HTH domain
MPRKSETASNYPELNQALRWLRHRAKLTQSETVERVRDAGGQMSDIYYSQCERGVKAPSEHLLDKILAALQSDTKELAQLTQSPPWQQKSPSRSYRMQRLTPKPMTTTSFLASSSSANLDPASDPELDEINQKWHNLSRNDKLTIMSILRRDK